MKISVNKTIKMQIMMFSSKSVEVGGFLYGEINNGHYCIKHITMKKGDRTKIKLSPRDSSLLISNHQFLGTWHTHITNGKVVPSSLDNKAVKKFKEDHIHLIFNLKGEYICLNYLQNIL